ncbi:hypothetical protein FCULG_00008410 [Fusarium culmorum]|uniref:Uncharacterized protein n=1 Tax=Fusarium culmorum TaxID=5516 RepID=A0A2T4H3V7_FUSCU|nr:hypothetical protein FCULG_00008410 [Fusarium culmorum]
MAPILANVGSWASLSTIHARSKKCYSWNCLTPSEQASVITSVVVTAMILLFVYMYYLGRITMAHQEAATRRQRRHRERRRTHTQLHPVSLVQLPIVPHYPSENVSQATRIMIPQHPIPAVTPLDPTTYASFPATYVNSPGSHPQPNRRPNPILSSAPSGRSSREHYEWWQRMRRVFGIPLGRASTINSDSMPGTPIIPASGRQVSQREARHGRMVPERTTLTQHRNSGSDRTLNSSYSGHNARNRDAGHRETTNVQSPPSAVATVHSDDYDIV